MEHQLDFFFCPLGSHQKNASGGFDSMAAHLSSLLPNYRTHLGYFGPPGFGMPACLQPKQPCPCCLVNSSFSTQPSCHLLQQAPPCSQSPVFSSLSPGKRTLLPLQTQALQSVYNPRPPFLPFRPRHQSHCALIFSVFPILRKPMN